MNSADLGIRPKECPRVQISAARLANHLCAIATASIVIALSLTHFNPRRFRIHPIPYLSDAGIRDPERIILSFGLSVTGALFIPLGAIQYLHMVERIELPGSVGPLRVSCALMQGRVFSSRPEQLARVAFWSTLSTSFFLALFTAIPGLRFLHHVFAIVFAISGATWCTVSSMFHHACAQTDNEEAEWPWRLLKIKYCLCVVQIFSWLFFGILWILLKLGIPWKFIPNKDIRFVFLALFEYAATAALLVFIHLTATNDLRPRVLCLTLGVPAKHV